MVATVRLNNDLSNTLNHLAYTFQKKKSDIIREAIEFYSKSLQDSKKLRLQKAINKTLKEDFKEYKEFESTINDGLK